MAVSANFTSSCASNGTLVYLKHDEISPALRQFPQGIRINVASMLLGHKDVATTYKIY
jgi:hypothetical protein